MFRFSSKLKGKISKPSSTNFLNVINTLVGLGTLIKGDFQVEGFLRIDGDLLGQVNCTERVVIGSQARMKGNIVAEEVVVAGALLGDIVAKSKVKLLSTSIVLGSIQAKALIIEEGAIFHGQSIILNIKEKDNLSSVDAISSGKKNGYFSPFHKPLKENSLNLAYF